MSMTLVIGTRKWSSWSLRPWIALKQAAIPFQEIVIPLRQPDTKARILEYSAAGKVPILIDGGTVVWESLAILDHLADRFPTRGLWPAEPAARAYARSIASEMHAGFAALRRELGMDISVELPTPDLSDDAMADVARVQAIWREARQRFAGDGPFLFGRFTNADAMYAPVATRFRTYSVEVDPVCKDYVDAVLNLPSTTAWYRLAEADEE